MVLSNWANINSVAYGACMGGELLGLVSESTCNTISGKLYEARKKTFEGVAYIAGVLAKIITAFGVPATGVPATTPINPRLALLTLHSGPRILNTTMEQTDAQKAAAASNAALMSSITNKWWLWAIVGLAVGGFFASRRAA